MKFSEKVSFNTNDTVVRVEGGRILVDRQEKGGVRQRCEIVLKVLAKNSNGLKASELLLAVNSSLKKTQYSRGDLEYALERMTKEKILLKKKGVFYLSKKTAEVIKSKAKVVTMLTE